MDIVSKSSKVPSRILSNEGTYRKDPNNLKREFDVLYKKSTENLFFVPPTKNLERGFKEKHMIWKSTAIPKDEQALKAPRPPKQKKTKVGKKDNIT